MEIIMNLNLKIKIIETFKSQAEFANLVNVDESLVSRIIRGRRRLDQEKQLIWAKALGCKTKDIFPDEIQNSN
jgi:transcriptional regulator with XRE-family HTH domain